MGLLKDLFAPEVAKAEARRDMLKVFAPLQEEINRVCEARKVARKVIWLWLEEKKDFLASQEAILKNPDLVQKKMADGELTEEEYIKMMEGVHEGKSVIRNYEAELQEIDDTWEAKWQDINAFYDLAENADWDDLGAKYEYYAGKFVKAVEAINALLERYQSIADECRKDF